MARSQTPETAPRKIRVGESLLELFGCNQNAIGKARAALAAHKINLKVPFHCGREQHEGQDKKSASSGAECSAATGASPRRTAHEVIPARAPTANSLRHGQLKSVASQVIGQHYRVSKTSAATGVTAKVKSPVKKTYGRKHSQIQLRPDIYDPFDYMYSRKMGDLATDNRNDLQSDASQSEDATFPPGQEFTQSSFTLKDLLAMRRQAPKSPIRSSSKELVRDLSHVDARFQGAGIAAQLADVSLKKGGSLLLYPDIEKVDEGDNNDAEPKQEDPDRSFFQPEYLDDRELEFQGEHGIQSPAPSAPSEKRPRHSTELFDVQHFDDAGEDELGTHPAKKRRTSRTDPKVKARNAVLQGLGSWKASKVVKNASHLTKKSASKKKTKSKKKKKKPRRLPVNELVTISDKLDGSEVEIPTNMPMPAELADDPISQPVEDFDRPKKVTGLKLEVKGTVRKFGKINAAQFRIPERRQRRLKFRSSPSYCDGFEGEEAAPLRIYMPIRRAPKRREARDKVLIMFPTLTIVADKTSSDDIEIEMLPHRRGKKKPNMPPKGQRPQKNPAKKLDQRPNLHDEENSMAFHQDIQSDVNENLCAEKEPVMKNAEQDGGTSQIPLNHGDQEQLCLEENNNFIIQEEDGTQHSSTDIQRDMQTPRAAAKSNILPKTLVSKSSCVDQDLKLSQAKRQESPAIHEARNRASSQFPSTVRISQNSKQVASAQRKMAQIRVSQEIAAVSVPRRSPADSDESDQESTSDHSSTMSYPCLEDNYESDAHSDHIGSTAEEIRQGESQEESQEGVHNYQGYSNQSEAAEILNSQSELALQHITNQNFGIQFSVQSSLFTPRPARSLVTEHPRHARAEEESSLMTHIMTDSDALQQQYQYEDPDASWRPRIPDTDGLSMELADDKIESPTRLPSFSRAITRPRRSSRHQSTMRGQPPSTAPLVDSISVQLQHPRGSPVLGESQITRARQQQSQALGQSQFSNSRSRSRIIPETQFEDEPELLEPATSVDLSESYLSFASRQLSQPFGSMAVSRMKSSPALRVFRSLDSEQALLSMSQAFRNTNSSPLKISQRQTPSQKDLSTLTRQSSMRMGTRPASARRKSINIPHLLSFNPRFKKDGFSQKPNEGESTT